MKEEMKKLCYDGDAAAAAAAIDKESMERKE